MVKVLFLIDDDEDDRQIFLEALKNYNPNVEMIFAQDGVQALDLLRTNSVVPDVIFLDYNMPRMNGLDCLRALKADSRFKTIPTIMYTTSGDREQEKLVLMLGADHYLLKANSFTHLCDELKRLLDIIGQNIVKNKSMAP